MTRRIANVSSVVGQLALLVAALVWAVLRVGPSIVETVPRDVELARVWPYPGESSNVAYLRTSPLGPLLFRGLSLEAAWQFVLLHMLALLVVSALIALWCFRVTDGQHRYASARIALLSPLVAILVINVGMYDPFTVLALALALFAWTSRRPWAMLGAGTLLGFQNFEQGVFMGGVWLLSIYAFAAVLPSRLGKAGYPLWVIPGLILGKGLQVILFIAMGVPPLAGRIDWLTGDVLRLSVTNIIGSLPTLLWASFAGLWPLIILAAVWIHTRRRQTALALAFATALVATVLALDNVRLFVLSAAPLALIAITSVVSSQVWHRERALRVAIEATAWLAVPYVLSTRVIDNYIYFMRDLANL